MGRRTIVRSLVLALFLSALLLPSPTTLAQSLTPSGSVVVDARVSTQDDTNTIAIAVTNTTSGGISSWVIRGSIPPGATLVSTNPAHSQVVGNEVVWFNSTLRTPGQTLGGFQYTLRGGTSAPTVTVDFVGTTHGSSTVQARLVSPGLPSAEFTQTLIGQLVDRQFQVSQGFPMIYPSTACAPYTYPATRNCYGNNPAAPYIVPIVPSWPDEYVDPSLHNSAGPISPGYSATYRLDPREAIVIYGQLPPPGRYFGLQTWNFSRQGHWNAEVYNQIVHMPNLLVPIQYLFDTIPPTDPNAQRVQSFSSLGNIVNNVVIQRQSGASFGQTRYFIITPDASMDEAVRSALQEQGVSNQDIFTEPIPPSDARGAIGPFGLDQRAPDFWAAIRYAIPDPGNETAAQQWRDNPPLMVLRVRAPSSQGAQPFPPLTFDQRTATSELGLAGDLQSLVNAVCNRASRAPTNLQSADCADPPPDASIMKDLVGDLGWTGPYCRQIGMNCEGDQQDATLFFSPSVPLDSGEVYAVISPLATKTGNATYSALSVNNTALLNGVANVLDTTLAGSADSYTAVSNHDKFFVHYFTRDCTAIASLLDAAKDCTSITPELIPTRTDTTAPGDPALHGQFDVGLRDYIRPGTARGPDPSQQLRPRIVKFTVRGR